MGERKLAEEMKSTPRPPETDGVSGCACGTINDKIVRVRAQSHFEQSTNDLKMGRGKRAGRWRAVVWPYLHIDDGSMGGGGPVPHDDDLYYNIMVKKEKTSFLTDIMENYFRPTGTGCESRKGIFHYAVFCHNLHVPDSDPPGCSQSGSGRLNSDDPRNYKNACSGEFFIIADNKIDTTDQAYVFMHELGHNLGLGNDKDGGKEYKSIMNYYDNYPYTILID